jgi:hypothetical protein
MGVVEILMGKIFESISIHTPVPPFSYSLKSMRVFATGWDSSDLGKGKVEQKRPLYWPWVCLLNPVQPVSHQAVDMSASFIVGIMNLSSPMPRVMSSPCFIC